MLWQTPTMSNTFLAIASHTRKTVLTLPTPSYLHFENGRTLNSNYPGRYEIVDDKGTRYYFEATEYSEYSYLYYYRMLQNTDMQKDKYRFISAWHLTKIKSLQGDSIMFEYQNMGERIYRVGGTYRYEDCFNSDYIKELVQGYTGADSYIDYYPKLLKRIVTSSEIVEFSYETTTVDVDQNFALRQAVENHNIQKRFRMHSGEEFRV